MTDAPSRENPLGVLVEAEGFDDHGGWTVDSQFESEMGSPYLLAHGLGRPVADAATTIAVPEDGRYHVWVRTKDWVPDHHPGRFALTVNGTRLDAEFGAHGRDWSWQPGGTVELRRGEVRLALHDLTGFDGRCDAIFLGLTGEPPPDEAPRPWRKQLLGLPPEPGDRGEFDVVVVGGGVTGCAAALAAARLGCRVALLQDRPLLGGNASKEIGLTPQGRPAPLIIELVERSDDGDLHAAKVFDTEPNVSVFLEHRVFDARSDGSRITSVDARDARTGAESRYRAPVFIDCTGTAILGLLTGARTLFGQEARSEFGEPLAPRKRVASHHGNTLFFRTHLADAPVGFPDVPWARKVAKDFAKLTGQVARPGVDNHPGPIAGNSLKAQFARTAEKGAPYRKTVGKVMRKLPDRLRARLTMGRFPGTHFWEYGQRLDPYTSGEHVRDHLLCALYGTLANIKDREPVTYANLEFDWVAHVTAKGEYRRYLGDYILTENDIRAHTSFDDGVVLNSGAFCLHHAGNRKYDFRLKNWTWDTRDGLPYEVPFRCLYSADIANLMMAGKHISVTHVAGGSTKFMSNGGQHAIATAAAAFLCKKHGTTPRGVYEKHLPELREVVGRLTDDQPQG
ncbi:FAD-dependent oxidoreductase [Amycolatopsis sp. NPDC049253]|uniref:FAD-dependent oxidoreductase n=1 Tax=Amycolatopsis sp. NPDC049253 TaxID=3155274 RepID=UPI00342924FF